MIPGVNKLMYAFFSVPRAFAGADAPLCQLALTPPRQTGRSPQGEGLERPLQGYVSLVGYMKKEEQVALLPDFCSYVWADIIRPLSPKASYLLIVGADIIRPLATAQVCRLIKIY